MSLVLRGFDIGDLSLGSETAPEVVASGKLLIKVCGSRGDIDAALQRATESGGHQPSQVSLTDEHDDNEHQVASTWIQNHHKISTIPGDFLLLPHRTVRENILYWTDGLPLSASDTLEPPPADRAGNGERDPDSYDVPRLIRALKLRALIDKLPEEEIVGPSSQIKIAVARALVVRPGAVVVHVVRAFRGLGRGHVAVEALEAIVTVGQCLDSYPPVLVLADPEALDSRQVDAVSTYLDYQSCGMCGFPEPVDDEDRSGVGEGDGQGLRECH